MDSYKAICIRCNKVTTCIKVTEGKRNYTLCLDHWLKYSELGEIKTLAEHVDDGGYYDQGTDSQEDGGETPAEDGSI